MTWIRWIPRIIFYVIHKNILDYKYWLYVASVVGFGAFVNDHDFKEIYEKHDRFCLFYKSLPIRINGTIVLPYRLSYIVKLQITIHDAYNILRNFTFDHIHIK